MIEEIKKISIIGAGNVGSHLAKVFSKNGLNVQQIFSRNIDRAVKIAALSGAKPINDLSLLNDDIDMLILAIPDDVIMEVCNKISLSNALIVHVSGSTSINIFEEKVSNYGVFYPLQTFSERKEVDFKDIPICIEANNQHGFELLKGLAGLISNDVRKIDSKQRLAIHIAAVFASNFTNFMNVLALDFLEKNNVKYDIMFPLINETFNKLLTHSPKEMQTGPAIRDDRKIIEKHIDILKNDSDKKEIYKLLSDNIKKYFN